MALTETFLSHTVSTPALAAPTTSETIAAPDDNTWVMVVVGGTATTVTVVTPGNDFFGGARPDFTTGSLTNATRLIKVDRNYRDPTLGTANILFSQVTGVTATILRFGRS